jgi:hypothetical protein
MIPLLEIAMRLKSMPPQGWSQDAAILHIAGIVREALHEAELERLPKCGNDERWGFRRAKLSV